MTRNNFDEPPLPTDIFDETPVIAENILDEPPLTSTGAFPPFSYVALSSGCMLTVWRQCLAPNLKIASFDTARKNGRGYFTASGSQVVMFLVSIGFSSFFAACLAFLIFRSCHSCMSCICGSCNDVSELRKAPPRGTAVGLSATECIVSGMAGRSLLSGYFSGFCPAVCSEPSSPPPSSALQPLVCLGLPDDFTPHISMSSNSHTLPRF